MNRRVLCSEEVSVMGLGGGQFAGFDYTIPPV